MESIYRLVNQKRSANKKKGVFPERKEQELDRRILSQSFSIAGWKTLPFFEDRPPKRGEKIKKKML